MDCHVCCFYSVSLLESVMLGTAVVTVTATDADDPDTNDYGTVHYSIIGKFFITLPDDKNICIVYNSSICRHI